MNGKRSIRENLRYLKRGYGLIWKLSPYLLIRDCAWRAAEALRPALGQRQGQPQKQGQKFLFQVDPSL